MKEGNIVFELKLQILNRKTSYHISKYLIVWKLIGKTCKLNPITAPSGYSEFISKLKVRHFTEATIGNAIIIPRFFLSFSVIFGDTC